MKVNSETDAARQNKIILHAAGISSVSLIGCAGCGKTSLIAAAAKRLACKKHIAIISADTFSEPAALGPLACGQQFLQIDPAPNSMLKANDIQKALGAFQLNGVKLLLIENVSGFAGGYAADLGQDAKVCVLSVAAGDGRSAEFAGAIGCADVIILNKIDMLSMMPFNVERFREDVHRINPNAKLFELSTLTGKGLAQWVDWLVGL